MLDNPAKAARLLAALKTAVPFEVELTPEVVKHLQSKNVAAADKMRIPTIATSRSSASRPV